MEHVYMHMKRQGRGPGTSRSLKVMVKLHMLSVYMIKMVKVNFMSLICIFPHSSNKIDAWLD